MIVIGLHRLLYGIQYSNVFATLWIYLTSLVQTDRPYLWYSLILVSFNVCGMIFTLVIGRISDRTRNIRACVLILTAVTIVGNVLYSLPLSVYYVFAGRFISGVIVATQPLVTGEVVRVYEENDIVRMLSIQGMCCGLGLIVGPAMNFAFVKIDYTIGCLHLTYANAPSLFLSVMFILLEVLMIFFLHNLSKELDLKAEYANANMESQQSTSVVASDLQSALHPFVSSLGSITSNRGRSATIISNSCIFDGLTNIEPISNSINNSYRSNNAAKVAENQILHDQGNTEQPKYNENSPLISQDKLPSVSKVLNKMLVSFDSVFIIMSSCLLNFVYNTSNVWTPLIVTDVLKWGVVELNSIFLISCVFSIAMTIFIATYKMSANSYYNLNLCVIIGLLLIETVFLVLKLHNRNLYLDIAVYSVYSILFGLTFAFEDAYLANIMAQMLPSDVQSLGESIRLVFLRVASIITLFTGGLVFRWIEFVAASLAVCLIVQFVVMVVRRKYLVSPKYVI